MRVSLFKSSSRAGRDQTGQSNIRGRISAPIPISDDDEFPMRQPGTGLATPIGGEIKNKFHALPEGSSAFDSQSTTAPSEVALEERTEPTAHTGPTQSPRVSSYPAQRRTNRSSTLRYSTTSTGTETDQSRSTPQRKKSTLRSTISKLFGRKRRDGSHGSSLETHHENPKSSSQHRSDPSALGRRPTRESEPKRSASLPITEFDRALRSHSIGPDDLIAVESARNSLTGEPLRFRRRAATTSSRLYIKDPGGATGLSPRPASAQGRGNSLGVIDDGDPDNIGRAITSDVLMQHRRSRSLSQLKDAAEGQTQRNRSDEIRYWRQSYDPGFQSPTSSNAIDDPANATVDPPETPTTTEPETKPQTPPQPFKFENIIGMKITQAASLEERIATLEIRNQKLEKLVSQLFQVTPGVSSYPQTPDREPPPLPTGTSTSQHVVFTPPDSSIFTRRNERPGTSRYSSSRHSNDSFGDGHTFVGSIPPSNITPNRPTSTATVRGATSLPTFPKDASGQFTSDHYATLMALLETERAARQALEVQVTTLSHKLNLLTKASRKTELKGAYSAFEHDEEEDEHLSTGGEEEFSESEAFKTPREEQPQYGFGAFGEELKDDDEDGPRKKTARTLSLSQLTYGKPPKPASEVGVNL